MKSTTKKSPIPKEVARTILSIPGASNRVAKLSGVSKAYVSLVLHGKRPPSQKLMGGMCRYFETSSRESRSSLALWELRSRMETETAQV